LNCNLHPYTVAMDGASPLPMPAAERLLQPVFLRCLTDLAPDSGPVQNVLVHICWRWEWASRLILEDLLLLLADIQMQGPDDVVPVLHVAERLLALDDWCASLRADAFLTGSRPLQPHIMFWSVRFDLNRVGLLAVRPGIIHVIWCE